MHSHLPCRSSLTTELEETKSALAAATKAKTLAERKTAVPAAAAEVPKDTTKELAKLRASIKQLNTEKTRVRGGWAVTLTLALMLTPLLTLNVPHPRSSSSPF